MSLTLYLMQIWIQMCKIMIKISHLEDCITLAEVLFVFSECKHTNTLVHLEGTDCTGHYIADLSTTHPNVFCWERLFSILLLMQFYFSSCCLGCAPCFFKAGVNLRGLSGILFCKLHLYRQIDALCLSRTELFVLCWIHPLSARHGEFFFFF